jgi:hypothetical protein
VSDSLVDSLLGHLAVSSPLATGDGEKTRFRDSGKVVADKTLRSALVGVADKGTDTRPGSKDITTADLDLRLEVALDLVEDPVDLVLRRSGVVLDGARRIGGTSNGVSLPGQEENHTSVRGVGVNKTHVTGSVVAGEDNVSTGRGSNNLLDLLVIELADRVGERTSGVDDTLGLDVENIASLAITLLSKILDSGTAELAIGVLLEAGNLAVVDNSSTIESSGCGKRHVHARVVVSTIVVDKSAEKALLLEHRECIESLATGQEVGAFNVLRTSEEVVELGAGPEVGSLPPLLDGNHDREPRGEMRSGVQEVATLAESLHDERILVVVELPDSLFQVTNTTVHKLGGL